MDDERFIVQVGEDSQQTGTRPTDRQEERKKQKSRGHKSHTHTHNNTYPATDSRGFSLINPPRNMKLTQLFLSLIFIYLIYLFIFFFLEGGWGFVFIFWRKVKM
jgi:hypothetical protein